MRDVVTTPVLVLRMSTSLASAAPSPSIPASSAQSCKAADMLPQFTLQSISPWSLASCANVLTSLGPAAAGSMSAKKTLLLVAGPRPRPVICRLAARRPASGTPIRCRSSSSRSAGSAGAKRSHSTSPVEVPPRMW
jgi:hypothetical protein